MKKLLVIAAFIAPSVASAQAITDFNSLTYKLTSMGNVIIQLLMAAAVIFIIWNAVIFILKADDPGARKEKGQAILWGALGLFAIISIWGIVNFLSGTFKTNTANPTQAYPTVPYPNQIP